MNDDSADFVAPPGISPNASATKIQRTMNAKADFMGAMGLETGDGRSLRAMQDITKVYETAGTSIRKSGAPFYLAISPGHIIRLRKAQRRPTWRDENPFGAWV